MLSASPTPPGVVGVSLALSDTGPGVLLFSKDTVCPKTGVRQGPWSYQLGPGVVGASLALSDTSPHVFLLRTYTVSHKTSIRPLCDWDGSTEKDPSMIMSEHRRNVGIV